MSLILANADKQSNQGKMLKNLVLFLKYLRHKFF